MFPMSGDPLRKHLIAFGLSPTEIDVYRAILRAGSATTGEIADAAGVSQGYVYEVVETLADRGFVAVDESTSPTTIRAREPEAAIDGLTGRIDDLESAIEAEYAGGAGRAEFEVVHSRATVRRRARSAIETADHEAFVVVPASEFEHLAGALADAVDRGVFVYCLLLGPDAAETADGLAEADRYANVLRVWEATPPVFVIADERTGVMGSYDVLSGRHGEEYALAFAQPEVASGFYGNLISNVWPMGETVFRSEPDPLPSRYDHLRTAVTNAALHREAGRELAADLLVERTDSGGRERFEDVSIVDVRQSLVGDPTAEFPMENSLVFEVDGQRYAVGNGGGGIDPFLEPYAAREVRLRER
ncbi:Sugar-specific transcriptional regulator TrmB [Halapricum desulfuricans]|uniref:Sugar-specific transcriptional regulator TrmB n=2 Tax=Halapricum desulfuricans TaxID=2841257 RepID=A0A897NCI6_9EURY|nr:Sugar-specific transcriptional regulator TrmB [Halapricum desulfuricans]